MTFPLFADRTMALSLAPKQSFATTLANKLFAGGFMCNLLTYGAELFTPARAFPFFLDFS